jgi:hypothetical protein
MSYAWMVNFEDLYINFDMKTLNVTLLIAGGVFLAACSSFKKANLSAQPEPTPEVKTVKRSGTYAPGIEEVNGIQAKFPGVTLEKLTAGYKLYTEGACIKCHNSNNIYKYSVSEWTNIIEDMSEKSKLTDTEKDAVSMYVMSIKAMQPM